MPSAPVDELLREVLDYAGMFPPAKRTIADAMATYAQHRAGPHAWMLGMFVVALERLSELDSLQEALGNAAAPRATRAGAWPVAVVMPDGSATAIEHALGAAGHVRVAALEFPPLTPAGIRDAAAAVPPDARAFFEIALTTDVEARLDAVAAAAAHAKIRTGGVTPDAFPDAASVYRFLRGCADRRMPCKATAGLHHAVTGRYPLTYESGSAATEMFGFLNLSVAAALVHAGAAEHDVVAALRDPSPVLSHAADQEIEWKGHRITAEDASATRRELFRSFGSCSLQEPIGDLQRMHLL